MIEESKERKQLYLNKVFVTIVTISWISFDFLNCKIGSGFLRILTGIFTSSIFFVDIRQKEIKSVNGRAS